MSHQPFFTPGGTLPLGSASYISRQADREIFAALVQGEYVYILDSRQKGKSSLIVRTIQHLRDGGVKTIRIDLQRLGTNLVPEQWYGGLLHSIGQEVNLTKELFEFWQESLSIGPAHRFFTAIEEVILPKIIGSIVIFVDEIDFVRALSFQTDEFFAAIRECFNRRVSSPEFCRLTFCLVGVASPDQLIANNDVTPFNIGRRIELTDFTLEETEPFAGELSRHGRNGPRLLRRIHFWVNGHPYLTQLLTHRLVSETGIVTPRDVDGLVVRTLLTEEVRQREPNIADTERRLLEASLPGETSSESRGRVLEAYRRMLRGDLVSANQEGALVSTLLLSGVAIETAGKLSLRNRLYRTIFDERWCRNNLPNAEQRRQRAAYLRALRKTTFYAVAALLLISMVFVRVLVLTHDRDSALADRLRLFQENRKIAYEASTALAAERISSGSYLKARELIDSQSTSPERGWEWFYLDQQLGHPAIWKAPIDLRGSQRSPFFGAWMDGTTLVEFRNQDLIVGDKVVYHAASSQTLQCLFDWLIRTRRRAILSVRLRTILPIMDSFSGKIFDLSSDGRWIASAVVGKSEIRITKIGTHQALTIHAPFEPTSIRFSNSDRYILTSRLMGSPHCFDRWGARWSEDAGSFSPDDRLFIHTDLNPEFTVKRTVDGATVSAFLGQGAPSTSFDWFQDGKRLVTCSADGTVRIWRISDGKQLNLFVSDRSIYSMVTLTPDEKSIIAVSTDGTYVKLAVSQTDGVQTIIRQESEVLSVRISPDGLRCCSTSISGKAKLIDLRDGHPIKSFDLGKPTAALPTAFSPDNQIVVLVRADGTIEFAESHSGKVLRTLNILGRHPISISYSTGGKLAIAFGEGGIARLDQWKSQPAIQKDTSLRVRRLAFSPDGSKVAIGLMTGQIAIVDPVSLLITKNYPGATGQIRDVEFSPSGNWLSACSMDRNAYLFALDGSGRKHTLIAHTSRVWQARFSPDGRRLLTTSFDGSARIWDVASGAQIAVLRHDSWVSAAEWSPDGRRVVTACSDKFLRTFDPENGFEIAKLPGHKASVLDVKFTPDGRSLVTCSSDHSIIVWKSDAARNLAHQITPEKLSIDRNSKLKSSQ